MVRYHNVRTWIGKSRGRATVFSILNVVLIPVIVGAWSDIIDVSEMLRGNWEVNSIIGLSFIIFIVALYIYLHGCSFYIQYKQQEDFDDAERQKSHAESERAELVCQRDFLLRLLTFFREVVGSRKESIGEGLVSSLPTLQDILDPSWQLERYVDAVRLSYLPLFNAASTLRALLLQVSGDRLEPVYSFNGTSRSWFDIRKPENADALRLNNVLNNLAVNAVDTGIISIIEDTSRSVERKQPFSYYGNADKRKRQQDKIKSALAIPFPNNGGKPKFVLVLDSNQLEGFREVHKWKAERVQAELGIRLELLEVFSVCVAKLTGGAPPSPGLAGS